MDADIPIAFGTDSGPPARFQGYFEHLELELMAEAGLSPEEILRSATVQAARCLRLDGSLGTLEPGNWADFVVFDENPLEDIGHSRTIDSVWIAGNPVPRAALRLPWAFECRPFRAPDPTATEG